MMVVTEEHVQYDDSVSLIPYVIREEDWGFLSGVPSAEEDWPIVGDDQGLDYLG